MIYALTNSKGGVGKSTLSVHLAVWLKEQGARVALVDSDVQGSSSVWLHEVDPEMRILRLQTPDDVLDQIPRIQSEFDHIVVDGPAGLSEVTRTILLVADVTFLPCGPSVLDLRAANDAIRAVRQVQRIRDGSPPRRARAQQTANPIPFEHRISGDGEFARDSVIERVAVAPGLRRCRRAGDSGLAHGHPKRRGGRH